MNSGSTDKHFSDAWPAIAEQRAERRKPIKTRATLTVKGAPPLSVRTIDISGRGVCLSFLQPMPIGLTGQLEIELLIEGRLHSIGAQGKAAYCIFSDGQYKVGFQFTSIDLPTITLLAKFLK